ncbi:hypothetical protein GGI25_005742 [Coemansia spiralis]|uniref:Bifunctional polynucleotide phosphatase/kinase n=2 Tax=Coemansia TaxID=4863 RepID=A0A9W8G3K6_9FUNG|nr:hypothetical protein EDC05_005794 [Coemansia umbellata]KAJ2619334.1 hypothetical protein GGI26_005910 [Coemansia sp. RSA 1358]KAJ2670720.1 hypothetical protein GGI25_005742 [Coemansia spiralis]
MTREPRKRKAPFSDNKPTKTQTLSKFFKLNMTKGAVAADNEPEPEPEVSENADSCVKSWVQWREIGGTWIGRYGSPNPAAKFAAFDLDSTLIRVKGNWKYPKGADDWRFFHPSVPNVLRNLHSQGYKIVIISNQNGLRKAKGSTELPKGAVDYRKKIANIGKQLGISLTILAATAKDYMRKPSPGMWHLAELDNSGIVVDKSASFYVGDAAGRLKGWKAGVEADFSDSDLAFALNAGVAFYTPEEVFNNSITCSQDELFVLPSPLTWSITRFTPKLLEIDHAAHSALITALREAIDSAKVAKKGLLLILVGPPACGKSTFTQQHLVPLGFERINMDILKTRKKCEDAALKSFKSGSCVVVDNTNPDPSSRSTFVAMAKTHGADSIAVVFEHKSRDLAIHNNSFRASLAQACHLFDASEQDHQTILSTMPVCVDMVPAVAYHSYFKKFVLPAESEGFSKILHHTFVPEFASPKEKKLWYQYY